MEAKYDPLSGAELLKIYLRMGEGTPLGSGGIPNIITYKELNGKRLDEILGPSGKAIILFMNSDNFGHWCALYRNSEGINFFDSYGSKPDQQYRFIPNHLAKKLNGHIRALTKLLYQEAKRGVRIQYNEYELQDFNDKKMATCGRWCVVRILYPEITVNDFLRIFKNRSMSPDDIVTLLTSK